MPSQIDQLGLRQLVDQLTERQRFTLNGATYGISPNQSGVNVQELSGKVLADRHGDFTGYTPLQNLQAALYDIEAKLAETAKENLVNILHQLTSEKYASLSQLRDLGHPYAEKNAKHFSFYKPNYVINRQASTGKEVFADSFQIKVLQPATNGGVYGILVANATPQAGYLAKGTDFMQKRPYDAVSFQMTQRAVADAVSQAAREARKIGVDPSIVTRLPVDYELGDDVSEKFVL